MSGLFFEGTTRKRETRCEDAEGAGTSRETEGERTTKERERGGATAEIGAAARRQEEKARVCIKTFHAIYELYRIFQVHSRTVDFQE